MLGKDLLGLYDTSAEDITAILDTAVGMKKLLTQNLKKLPHLQGRTVTTLFYENSTRTRCSFELAAKYLGAGTVNISASSSSVQKGETLIDTGRTLDAMKNDVIVIRHPMGGAPHLLAKNVKASVINGGDGMNEHPTQALLDFYTMREKFGSFKGLKVAILGDIKHSRVAKSNLFGLTKLGAEVTMFAPCHPHAAGHRAPWGRRSPSRARKRYRARTSSWGCAFSSNACTAGCSRPCPNTRSITAWAKNTSNWRIRTVL